MKNMWGKAGWSLAGFLVTLVLGLGGFLLSSLNDDVKAIDTIQRSCKERVSTLEEFSRHVRDELRAINQKLDRLTEIILKK
jgi:hypothetical protein